MKTLATKNRPSRRAQDTRSQAKKVPVVGIVENDVVQFTPKGEAIFNALKPGLHAVTQENYDEEDGDIPNTSDDTLLAIVGRWKVARQSARLTWAKTDHNSLFGRIDDIDLLIAPSQEMITVDEMQKLMLTCEPKTVRGLLAMLSVAIDILEERERGPGRPFGKGPVLNLLRKAILALERTPLQTSVNVYEE
ncbi:MAG: hypothetical protein AB7R90_10465 [Reyranellaceae bacterium]